MIGFDNNVYSMLSTAIQQEIPVWLVYDGTRRLVCPCSLGTSRKGQRNLLAYQIDGESSTGLGHPWLAGQLALPASEQNFRGGILAVCPVGDGREPFLPQHLRGEGRCGS